MAGESADDVARRAREKADRLIKRAEAFEKGAAGERLVADVLKQLPSDWFVLNDRRWPGRSRANIDHVVVGPPGVFVIDAKNWSGNLAVKNGVFRQNGYSRMNTVEAALDSAKAVAGLFAWIPAGYFVPIVCFVGEATLDAMVNGVEICSLENLLGLMKSRSATLPPETLQFLRFDLDMSTGSASGSSVAVRHDPPPRIAPHLGPAVVPRQFPQSGGQARSIERAPRLARFGLACFWFFVGSLILGLTLPAAQVSESAQGAAGFALLVGCVVYFFRKR